MNLYKFCLDPVYFGVMEKSRQGEIHARIIFSRSWVEAQYGNHSVTSWVISRFSPKN